MCKLTFRDIAVGDTFYLGGTLWRKRSSRTSALAHNAGVWFYFGPSETVRNS